MEQAEGSRKGKHLTREERVVVERMSRGGRFHRTDLYGTTMRPPSAAREFAACGRRREPLVYSVQGKCGGFSVAPALREESGTVREDILEASVDKLHTTFDRTDLDIEWKKIQEKIEEARYSPGSVRPLADCIFSLMLAARSQGYRADAVLRELEKVAEHNLNRRWKKMEDGTYRAT